MNFADFAPAALRWATAMFKQFPIMSSSVVLMMVIVSGMITYMATHITRGISVAISRVEQKVFANYAGFPVDKQEWDAQAIDYGEITITNISAKENVALNLTLHITGKDGTDLKAPTDLVGPFGMIMGKDDLVTKHLANSSFGEPPKYFRNPIELAPGQTERKRLKFLFNFGGLGEIRGNFAMSMMRRENYNFDLEISDLISGNTKIMHLPAEYRGDK